PARPAPRHDRLRERWRGGLGGALALLVVCSMAPTTPARAAAVPSPGPARDPSRAPERTPDRTDAPHLALPGAVPPRPPPGAVIRVGQAHRPLPRRARGPGATRPAEESMTTDTIFDLASLTKVVATAPAILALRDEGRLDLDAPISRYLRELPAGVYRDVTIR